jgi:hypothetical protein
MIVRVSVQRQVILPKMIYEELGQPRHLVTRLRGSALMMEPAIMPSDGDAMALLAREGITCDVLKEALRIVGARNAAA